MSPPSSPPTPPASPSSPQPREAAFRFILLTLFLDVLGVGLIIPVLPRLVVDLASHSQTLSHLIPAAASTLPATNPSDSSIAQNAPIYGLFGTAYSLMMFLCAPLLGALSDRFGRRPVLLISIAGSAADYLFQTFAPTLALLLVGRLINGMTAANFTTANAYVADVTPPEQRAKRFGLTGAAFGVGFVLGPPIGGILGHYHPRLPFALAAVLAIINVLYGLFVLPESHKKENRSPFSWKKTNPFGTLWVLSKFQGLLPLAGILAAVNLAMFSLHATWVLYTAYRFNWSTLDVGLSLGFVGVMTGMVQGGLTGRIVKKIGEYKTLYLGLALAAIGYTIYGLSPTGAVMYAGILFHSLSGIAGPAAQAIVTQRAGPKNQGLVQGALSSLSALAGIIAPLSATYLFHLFTENNAPLHLPGIPFLTGATLCLLGLLLALAIVRPPLTTPTESPIPA